MNNETTVYKASAGSGKTFTLAVHYIKLLVLAEGPDEYAHILGVTFTNKATTEMKDRILTQLYGIGHALEASKAYYDALCKVLGDDGMVLEESEIRCRCQAALGAILHDYDRFRVMTIDAFFSLILRSLAHELGLNANLQVDLRDSEVLADAVDRLMGRLQDEPSLYPIVRDMVQRQIDENGKWDVTDDMKDFGKQIFGEDYTHYRGLIETVTANISAVKDFKKQMRAREKEARERVGKLADALEQVLCHLEQHGIPCARFCRGAESVRTLVSNLRKKGPSAEISATVRDLVHDPTKLLRKNDLNDAVMQDAARQLSTAVDEVVRACDDEIRAYNSAVLARTNIDNLCLLGALDKEVAAINDEAARFNLSRTGRLLHEMVQGCDAPFVFEKMGALLHHIMIDEFQDTSGLQWDNFRTLLLETYARGGNNLIVGDVKQSIYRWRNGDWRILGHIERYGALVPHVKPLDVNYRSDRRVITFNNAFFSSAAAQLDAITGDIQDKVGETFSFATVYADVEQQIPDSRPDRGYVRIEVLQKSTFDTESVHRLADTVKSLHSRGLPYEEMCILVRYNREAQTVLEGFADDPDLPPVVSDEAFLLRSSRLITLLVAMLRVMDTDEELCRSLLRFNGIDPQRIDQNHDTWSTLSLYELVETLYATFGMGGLCPDQEAFLFAFLDAVTDFQHTDSSNVHAFLQFWDETLSTKSIPASRIEGIRILTIHKAKGLEYHTLFVPFANWKMCSDKELLWCQPAQDPYAKMGVLPVKSRSQAGKSVFEPEYLRNRQLQMLDEFNALYVALTRAEHNLYVWIPEQGKNETAPGVHHMLLDFVGEARVYEQGEPVLPEAFAVVQNEEERRERESNRMESQPDETPVGMSSHDAHLTFVQSNQSRQFVDTLTADERTPEDTTRERYIAVGTLLHRVLERIETTNDVPRVLDDFEREGLITATSPDTDEGVCVSRHSVETAFAKGMSLPEVADWFSGRWHTMNECTILVRDDDGIARSHRPDRVMMSADGGDIVVVDFKFGDYRPEYQDQVLRYMSHLQRMYPKSKVRGYLWLVYHSRIIEVKQ